MSQAPALPEHVHDAHETGLEGRGHFVTVQDVADLLPTDAHVPGTYTYYAVVTPNEVIFLTLVARASELCSELCGARACWAS